MAFVCRPGSIERFTAAEFERAKTWLTTIAEACLPDPVSVLEGAERKFKGTGGLHINTRGRGWFDHGANVGGSSAIKLVMHLKKCGGGDAVAWLVQFLRNHEGTGPCDTTSSGNLDDDDATPASAAECRGVLDQIQEDLTGTTSKAYLNSRALPGPYPVGLLGHLENARIGEGALVGKLTAHNRITGVMLTYLMPDGRKSLVNPVRRRLNLEKSPGATFIIPPPEDRTGTTDMAADIIAAEGLEDALSLAMLRRSAPIFGLPGISALSALEGSAGKRVRACRDGDAPGSTSDQHLQNGLDHLLLQGAIVTVTAPPVGEDNNSILQQGGTAALLRLFNKAKPAKLSFHAEFAQEAQRLSKLDKPAYDRERREAAKTLKVRLGTLDEAVRGALRKHSGDGGAQDQPLGIPNIVPWDRPVTGTELLDAVSAGVCTYSKMHDYQADATALWSVFTHLADRFDVSPKLIINSAQKRSGKSRLLEVLERLVAKPVQASSITAAAFTRVVDRCAPTLLLDEFDAMLKGDPEKSEALRGLLNSGFNRAGAYRLIAVPVPGGGWQKQYLSTFCPQVIAGIGEMPDTISDRAVIIEMQRKRRTDKVAQLRLRDGDDLRELARKAARCR